jgi:Holliday junction resolvase RusA-like endonuclease
VNAQTTLQVIPVIPFEFIVIGKPISHQTKDRKRLQAWKTEVRRTAELCWKTGTAVGDSLRVTITHYYDALPGDESGVPDSDNIVKPVRDALNGLIYVDDYQITDFVSRRRSLNGSFRVKGMSAVLAEGFCKGEEFLHIFVEAAPDPTELR